MQNITAFAHYCRATQWVQYQKKEHISMYYGNILENFDSFLKLWHKLRLLECFVVKDPLHSCLFKGIQTF